jgi:hypothetical protein
MPVQAPDESPYSHWPRPSIGSMLQGSFEVPGPPNGVFEDQQMRNTDISVSGVYNHMERYVSTCAFDCPAPPSFLCPAGKAPPYAVGCTKPLEGSGQIQWVKWRAGTLLPEDCPQ